MTANSSPAVPPDDPFQRTLPNVHEAVRKSQLMLALHEKLDSPSSTVFPFAAEFARLRDMIAPQIGDTRILFPEFTPHDEALHVAKLFQLADKLFGVQTFKQMKASELFLLAAALYAHDWGMAVGQDERIYLEHRADEGFRKTSFAPLEDELDRMAAFVRAEGVGRTPEVGTAPLTILQLRLYVRSTHARRSGARVRALFREHPAVGQALAHLCEGHWHDPAVLDDATRFPREFEAAGDTNHLLALTLQVRLIDLLHLTDDRTPYALWRFVSPTDSRSAKEWKKHRALTGLSISTYPPGRAIKVQGFTEDEEVWAGLQDLRRYCENQLAAVFDLSARHVPTRYSLDFLKLDWAVPTGDLRPVDFKFSFDRAAMFRILSDDIYDGNKYVFLRELLQNSIDAIRTRRARHAERAKAGGKKKKPTPSFDTTIYFHVRHKDDGDITVRCRDFGIGMDEHVIRNYFLVAGVSYYRSAEFEHQQLGFVPVSRFGIGILSCFMVADQLEVDTYRDPDCGPAMAHADRSLPGADDRRPRRLSLRVPGVERQFIVKELISDFEVGTEVRVNVLAEKVRGHGPMGESGQEGDDDGIDRARKPMSPFDRCLEVTEYLSKLAGFVEFPILVEETWPGSILPKRTLILHPSSSADQVRDLYEGEPEVHQLSPRYPWSSVAEENCLEDASEWMTGEVFDVDNPVGDPGYEGWIVVPVPARQDLDFGDAFDESVSTAPRISFRDRRTGEVVGPVVYWKDRERRSADSSALYGVYRDGLLVESVGVPRFLEQFSSTLPPTSFRINLPSTEAMRLNVARTRLAHGARNWAEPIRLRIEGALMARVVDSAIELVLMDRFYRLGWIRAAFGPIAERPIRGLPFAKLPFPLLLEGDRVEFREGASAIGDRVCVCPEPLSRMSALRLQSLCIAGHSSASSPLVWQGPPSIIVDSNFPDEMASLPLCAALENVSMWLFNWAIPSAINHIDVNGSLLAQHVYSPMLPADRKTLEILNANRGSHAELWNRTLQLAMSDPDRFSPFDVRVLMALRVGHRVDFGAFPLPFGPPLERSAGTIDGVLNAAHSFTRQVTRCVAALTLENQGWQVSPHLRSQAQSIMAEGGGANVGITDWTLPKIHRLFEFVARNRLIAGFVPPEDPNASEFVDDTGEMPDDGVAILVRSIANERSSPS